MLIAVLVIAFATSASAVDAIFGIGGGIVMQKGEATVGMYTFDINIPTITDTTKDYYVVTSTEIVYSDRQFDDVQEIEATKVMITGHKSFGLPVYLNLGAGTTRFVNSSGANDWFGVYRAGFSYEVLGVEIGAVADIIPLANENDMYNIFLRARIVGL